MWRHLHLKDIATFANLYLSFYSVTLLFQNQFLLASSLLFFNVMILDLLDGFIARLTKKSNEFGKHLDSLTDFFGSSMILPFFIYKAYHSHLPHALVLIVAFMPLVAGVLREIEAKMNGIKQTTYFIGLPRNTSGLFIVAYLNSSFFAFTWFQWMGIAVLTFVSLLQLSHWPYLGNDKSSLVLAFRVKCYLIIAVLATLTGLFLGFFWDAVTLLMFGYIISPPFLTEKEIWQKVKLQCQKAT